MKSGIVKSNEKEASTPVKENEAKFNKETMGKFPLSIFMIPSSWIIDS